MALSWDEGEDTNVADHDDVIAVRINEHMCGHIRTERRR